MGWFSRRNERREPLYGGVDVVFLGAQHGDTELRLAQAVASELRNHASVERAYLARVRYGAIEREEVALCLVGEEDERVFDALQKIFWALFQQGQHLDMFFVNADEERTLRACCEPLFER